MVFKSTSKSIPVFGSLYWFGETGSTRHFRAKMGFPPGHGFAVTRGEVKVKEPVGAQWMMGGPAPADIIWTGVAAPVIISDRIVELLQSFTGWQTYEVQLHGKGGERVPGYHGLAIHGRCGPIDDSRSVQVPKQFPGGVFPVYKGLYFDPETWDGSDLFMPADGAGFKFVVEDVKRAFEKAKIKNILFTPLDEVERLTL